VLGPGNLTARTEEPKNPEPRTEEPRTQELRLTLFCSWIFY